MTYGEKQIMAQLKNAWEVEKVRANLQDAARPLDKPVQLVETFTELLINATADFRTLEKDTRDVRSVLNHSGSSMSCVVCSVVVWCSSMSCGVWVVACHV
jgi:hypothetical protein